MLSDCHWLDDSKRESMYAAHYSWPVTSCQAWKRKKRRLLVSFYTEVRNKTYTFKKEASFRFQMVQCGSMCGVHVRSQWEVIFSDVAKPIVISKWANSWQKTNICLGGAWRALSGCQVTPSPIFGTGMIRSTGMSTLSPSLLNKGQLMMKLCKM